MKGSYTMTPVASSIPPEGEEVRSKMTGFEVQWEVRDTCRPGEKVEVPRKAE